MIKMTINDFGLPTGFYDSKFHENIPSNSIKITNTQYHELISNIGFRYWDNKRIKVLENSETLKKYKKLQISIINQSVINLYADYSDPIKNLIYQEKTDQALDYIADGEPGDLSMYPFIKNEVEDSDKSPGIVAQEILNKRSDWIILISNIDRYERKTIHIIENASSISEIDDYISSNSFKL
jgi:hypothetical protein